VRNAKEWGELPSLRFSSDLKQAMPVNDGHSPKITRYRRCDWARIKGDYTFIATGQVKEGSRSDGKARPRHFKRLIRCACVESVDV
jgi:hypothetical protein